MFMTAQVVLVVAALLCSLVAGFLFAFAAVVMPGIRSLGNREFLRAFQVMDRIIQRGDPLFGIVWLGSIVTLVGAVGLGLGYTAGLDRTLLVVAGGVYLLGVQFPTFRFNIPLNNELQKLDVDRADDAAWRSTRERFEPQWNRWNTFRSIMAVVASAMLLIVLLRW